MSLSKEIAGGGGVRMVKQKGEREKQLIRLGDDSPMLGIYSIGREVWGWRSEVCGVWEAARTASSHQRGVVKEETETAEMRKHR